MPYTTQESEDSPVKLKVVLVGETHGGKTSLALRFCKDTFYSELKRTIGAAFQSKSMTISKKRIMLNIWDTGGEERYQCLAPIYYRNAHGAVVVYDITSMHSFERARGWVDEIRKNCGTDPIIALAGNKVDLDQDRNVPQQTAQSFAQRENLAFFETSAKDDINVSDLFMFVARHAAQNVDPLEGGIQLGEENGQSQHHRGGCWC